MRQLSQDDPGRAAGLVVTCCSERVTDDGALSVLASHGPWKALSALSVEDDADEKSVVLPPLSDPLSSTDEHTHLRRVLVERAYLSRPVKGRGSSLAFCVAHVFSGGRARQRTRNRPFSGPVRI